MTSLNVDYYRDIKCIDDEIFLSVIIPVYNVQDYVEQCLVSLVGKLAENDLPKVEVIVVDDGSTDRSLSIIQGCVSKFPVIKIFTKENGGLSDARNFGLDCATGQYISFIDSDDIVDENFIHIILNCINKYSFDILSFNFEKFFTKPTINKITELVGFPVHDVALDFYEEQAIFAWNKIYNKKLFRKEKFTKGLYYEDVDLVPILLSNAEKRMHLFYTCYYYRQRLGAITFFKDDKYLDILKGVRRVRDVSKNQFIDSFTMNQFFTLCLISLRLPTRHYISNMKIISQYYVSNFNVDKLRPKIKLKHMPFWMLKLFGEKITLALMLLKPAVLFHQALKNIRGKKNVKV